MTSTSRDPTRYCFCCCNSSRNFTTNLSKLKLDFVLGHIKFLNPEREVEVFEKDRIEYIRKVITQIRENKPDLFSIFFPHLLGKKVILKTGDEFIELKKKELEGKFSLPCSKASFCCDFCYLGVSFVKDNPNSHILSSISKRKIIVSKKEVQFDFQYDSSHPTEFKGSLNGSNEDRNFVVRADRYWKSIKSIFQCFVNFLEGRFEGFRLGVEIRSFSHPIEKCHRINLPSVEVEKNELFLKKSLALKLILSSRKYVMVRNVLYPEINLLGGTLCGKEKAKYDEQYCSQNVRYNYDVRNKKRQFLLKVDRLNLMKAICIDRDHLFDIIRNTVIIHDKTSKRRSIFHEALSRSEKFSSPQVTKAYYIEKQEEPVIHDGKEYGFIASFTGQLGDCIDATLLESNRCSAYSATVGRMTTIDSSNSQNDDSTVLTFMVCYDNDNNKLTPTEFRELVGGKEYGQSLAALEKEIFPIHIPTEDAKNIFGDHVDSDVLLFAEFRFTIKNDDIGNKESHFGCVDKGKKSCIQTVWKMDEKKNERYNILTKELDDDGEYDNLALSQFHHLTHLIRMRDFVILGTGDEPDALFESGSVDETIYSGLDNHRFAYDVLVHMIRAKGRGIRKAIDKGEDFVRKCLKKRDAKDEYSLKHANILAQWGCFKKKKMVIKKDAVGREYYSRKNFNEFKFSIQNVDGGEAEALLGNVSEKKKKNKFKSYALEIADLVEDFELFMETECSEEQVDSEGMELCVKYFQKLDEYIGTERMIHSILKEFPCVDDNKLFVVLPRLLVKSSMFWYVFSPIIGTMLRYISYSSYFCGVFLKIVFDGQVFGDGMQNTERKNSGKSGSKEFYYHTMKFRRHGKYRKLRLKHVDHLINHKVLRNNNYTDTMLGMIFQENMLSGPTKAIYFHPELIKNQESFTMEDADELKKYDDRIKDFLVRVSKRNGLDPVDQDYLNDLRGKIQSKKAFEDREIRQYFEGVIDFGKIWKEFWSKFNTQSKKLSWDGPLDEEVKNFLKPDQLEFYIHMRKKNGRKKNLMSDEDGCGEGGPGEGRPGDGEGGLENEDLLSCPCVGFFGGTSIGKTIATISAIITHLHESKNGVCVVVAPGLVLQNWEKDITLFCESVGVNIPKLMNVYSQKSPTSKVCFRTVKKIVSVGGVMLLNSEMITTLKRRKDRSRSHSIDVYSVLYNLIFADTTDELMLILDEVHDVLAGDRCDHISETTSEFKIGLTATPLTDLGPSLSKIINFLFSHIQNSSVKESLENLKILAEKMKKSSGDIGRLKSLCSEADKYLEPIRPLLFVRLKPVKVYSDNREIRQDEVIIVHQLCDEQKKKIEKIENLSASNMIRMKKMEPVLFTPLSRDIVNEKLEEIELDELNSSRVNIVIKIVQVAKKQGKAVVVFCRTVLVIKIIFQLITRNVMESQMEEVEDKEEVEGEEDQDEEIADDIDPDIHHSKLLCKIHGSCNRAKREKILRIMEKLKGFRVLLIQSKIGNKGLNLPWAKYSISFENYWRHDEDHQEAKRTYRYGKKEDSLRIKFLGTHLEYRMFQMMYLKGVVLLNLFEEEKVDIDPSAMDIPEDVFEKFFDTNDHIALIRDKTKTLCEDLLFHVCSAALEDVKYVVKRESLEDFILKGGQTGQEEDDEMSDEDDEGKKRSRQRIPVQGEREQKKRKIRVLFDEEKKIEIPQEIDFE